MKILVLLCFVFSQALYTQISGLTRVHSHNDYQQDNPFWEAYRSGAHSIEVDIFLKMGTLFVTHNESEIKETEDLESRYLQPLQRELSKGSLREVQLLIDLKSEAEKTLLQLIVVLQKYEALLQSRKVMWVISGNRPSPSAYTEYPSYLLFDYQSLTDLKDPEIWKRVALISLPFYRYSKWDGRAKMSRGERKKIRRLIKKAHTFKKPFRFWATPDTELAWKTLAKMGLDFVNTDHPSKCIQALKAK